MFKQRCERRRSFAAGRDSTNVLAPVGSRLPMPHWGTAQAHGLPPPQRRLRGSGLEAQQRPARRRRRFTRTSDSAACRGHPERRRAAVPVPARRHAQRACPRPGPRRRSRAGLPHRARGRSGAREFASERDVRTHLLRQICRHLARSGGLLVTRAPTQRVAASLRSARRCAGVAWRRGAGYRAVNWRVTGGSPGTRA